jgi:hypothetical protein
VGPSSVSWYLVCVLGMHYPRFGTRSPVHTVHSPKKPITI